MKDKHLQARIQQCQAIAECSPCPRRKFGALLIDPTRNVVLMDGYNGGPRGGGSICGGNFCLRDGAPTDPKQYGCRTHFRQMDGGRRVPYDEVVFLSTEHGEQDLGSFIMPWQRLDGGGKMSQPEEGIRPIREAFIEANPPIPSGTRYEVGCHHAEMNVITNAAARGVSCEGAWLIVTGEPCVLCAKLIHHAGIAKVICVDGGFIGGKAGVDYLKKHRVQVDEVAGPQDPRKTVSSEP